MVGHKFFLTMNCFPARKNTLCARKNRRRAHTHTERCIVARFFDVIACTEHFVLRKHSETVSAHQPIMDTLDDEKVLARAAEITRKREREREKQELARKRATVEQKKEEIDRYNALIQELNPFLKKYEHVTVWQIADGADGLLSAPVVKVYEGYLPDAEFHEASRAAERPTCLYVVGSALCVSFAVVVFVRKAPRSLRVNTGILSTLLGAHRKRRNTKYKETTFNIYFFFFCDSCDFCDFCDFQSV